MRSRTKSRSETASSELVNGSIPSSSAVSLGSTGCGVPPSAAAPSGETFAASLAALEPSEVPA